MIILSIETSCDETAISIVKAEGGLESPHFSVLGNALFSQVELHAEYGGVYPNLAKREHAKNLTPLLKKALEKSGFLKNKEVRILNKENEKSENLNSFHRKNTFDISVRSAPLFPILNSILIKEYGLAEQVIPFLEQHEKPAIDMIAVTSGPGLEPALWVGISFAKALGLAWDIPVVATNHMKGHVASVLLKTNQNIEYRIKNIEFPALALLISGGHTEIVHIEKWGSYRILGQTRDDAVGEAFDKVARMLGLPYPGGPQISLLADKADQENIPHTITLPRPMIHSNDLDFSFSGLKTSVLYTIRDITATGSELTDDIKAEIAREFENAVVDVLLKKTEKAILESNARSLIIAGGVIANKKIRQSFTNLIAEKYPDVALFIPDHDLATDNAVMIAMASYIETCIHPELLENGYSDTKITAQGNLQF